MWGTSALASLGAGGVLALGGFALVVTVAGVTLALPVLVLVLTERSLPSPSAAGAAVAGEAGRRDQP